MGDPEGELWGDGECRGPAAFGGFLALCHCPGCFVLQSSNLHFMVAGRQSFLWCMERSACRDSVVLIMWQHLCKSLEGMEVETLAKSVCFDT